MAARWDMCGALQALIDAVRHEFRTETPGDEAVGSFALNDRVISTVTCYLRLPASKFDASSRVTQVLVLEPIGASNQLVASRIMVRRAHNNTKLSVAINMQNSNQPDWAMEPLSQPLDDRTVADNLIVTIYDASDAIQLLAQYGLLWMNEPEIRALETADYHDHDNRPCYKTGHPFARYLLGASPSGGTLARLSEDQLVTGETIEIEMIRRASDAFVAARSRVPIDRRDTLLVSISSTPTRSDLLSRYTSEPDSESLVLELLVEYILQ